MTRTPRIRLKILCEDAAQRAFAYALCERHGISRRDITMLAAPSGQGSGKNWVIKKYAAPSDGLVRTTRSKNFQPQLGWLAIVDGDAEGAPMRLRELEEELRRAGLQPRSASEPLAIFVPTWSIETWLLWLWGDDDVDEKASYKQDGRAGTAERAKRSREAHGARRPAEAAAAFDAPPRAGESVRVPSLVMARQEAKRLPGFS